MSRLCLIEKQAVAVHRKDDCLAAINRIIFYLV